MSAARQMLNLSINTDDYALLGVSPGSSRAQIIHAAQGRLNAIAVHSQAESQEAQLARLEIRSAAQRLVAIAAKDAEDMAQKGKANQALFGDDGQKAMWEMYSNILKYEKIEAEMRTDLAYSPK